MTRSPAAALVAFGVAALTVLAPVSSASAAATNGLIVLDDSTTGQVYTLTSTGSDFTQVTHLPAGQVAIFPRWSPDGAHIVFDLVANQRGRIYTIAPDGTHLHKVRTDGAAWNNDAPSYFPNGKRLVFARCRHDGSGCVIATVRTDGTDLRTLTPLRTEVYDFAPVVSPDGSHIAFARINANGIHAQIWMMNSDGSHAHAVTPPWLEANRAEWAPGGGQLSVSSNCCRLSGDIYRVPVSGGAPVRITHTPWPLFSGDGSYAPSGSRIAFVSNRNYPQRDGTDLFVMHADGTDRHKVNIPLTTVDTINWGPASS